MKGRRVMTVRMLESAARLYADGRPQRAIAESLGICRGTLDYWMRARPDLFPPRSRGREWWEAHLGEVEGLSASEAARRLGCHRHTVWRWRRMLCG